MKNVFYCDNAAGDTEYLQIALKVITQKGGRPEGYSGFKKFVRKSNQHREVRESYYKCDYAVLYFHENAFDSWVMEELENGITLKVGLILSRPDIEIDLPSDDLPQPIFCNSHRKFETILANSLPQFSLIH